MATLLLPDLSRDMAALNRRAVNSVEAERRQIEQLQHEPKEWNALQQRVGRGARQVVRQAVGNAPGAQAIWETTREIMQNGLSGESLRELLQDIREAIGAWLALAENAREMTRLATAIGAPAPGLEDLQHKETEIREVNAAVEKIIAFATRTKPPVDPALLQKGMAEIEQGKVRTPEQMRARRDAPKA